MYLILVTVWQATIAQTGNSKFCAYDSDIATGLGVGSILVLFASQVIVMVATRCLCCGKALRPSGSRAWAITLFITCWYVPLLNLQKAIYKFCASN